MKLESIYIRCTEQFKEQLKTIAEQNGLSVSAYMTQLATKEINNNGGVNMNTGWNRPIDKINEILEKEGFNFKVYKERKDILIYDLVEGYSKEIMINGKSYVMELLQEKKEEEVIYKGVYLTRDGEFVTTFTV